VDSFVVYKGVVDRVNVRHGKRLRELAKNLDRGSVLRDPRLLEEGLLILFVQNTLDLNPTPGGHRE
jgi:hypothetical protein